MKDKTILTKLKKYDCDIDNLTIYQNACGGCRVCKYLEFLDYADSVGKPEGSTIEYNKEIDRYLEVREFYKSLLAKKMAEVEKDLDKAFVLGSAKAVAILVNGRSGEIPHNEFQELKSKYKSN